MKKMMMTAAAVLALAGMNLQTAKAGIPFPPPPPFVVAGAFMAGAAVASAQSAYCAPAPVYYAPGPAYCAPAPVYCAPTAVYGPRYAWPAPVVYGHWGWRNDHYRGFDRDHYHRR